MNYRDTAGMTDFGNDRPEGKPKSKFDEFLFALVYLADERSKEKPHAEAIDSWYRRAQVLFDAAIAEAVRLEIERVNLRVVVERT